MSTKGNCPVCGKEVVVSDLRDVRANRPIYCGKVCATSQTYRSTRFRGAGESQKPSLEKILSRKAY